MYKKYLKLKEARGITDYRVAVDTGIPASTFSDWKSGRSSPKIAKLKILADYFGVNIEYFLSDWIENNQEELDNQEGDDKSEQRIANNYNIRNCRNDGSFSQRHFEKD